MGIEINNLNSMKHVWTADLIIVYIHKYFVPSTPRGCFPVKPAEPLSDSGASTDGQPDDPIDLAFNPRNECP
jgi:hypothetical protein